MSLTGSIFLEHSSESAKLLDKIYEISQQKVQKVQEGRVVRDEDAFEAEGEGGQSDDSNRLFEMVDDY